ncbi:MAG: DNRLRE domain-containing protein, partial [Dehalococcoidia bacterium]|nr:DNRLRE domain-containing protein [Dehalococcoidia bacterium]
LYLTLALPLRGSNTLTASTEAEQALETISRDGRSAVAFATPAGLPGYGTFSWTDFTSASAMAHTVTYYYSPTVTGLFRQEAIGATVSSREIARNILKYGDVSFVPVAGNPGTISATVTSTISTASPSGVVSRTATSLVQLRPQEPRNSAVLQPTGDSYVDQNGPNQNFGTGSTLDVQSNNTKTPNSNRRTFVAFGLSSIPSGTPVQSAKLRLFMTQSPASSRTYNASRVTAVWAQSTMTWNNQPPVAPSATSSTATGTNVNVWLTWDVTPDVQAFVNGTLPNYGWRIKDGVESDSGTFLSVFDSQSSRVPGQRPQLVIDYTAPGAQPGETYTQVFALPDDSYVDQNSVNSNYSTQTTMLVLSGAKNDRAFVHFDTAGLPANKTIVSASLSVYMAAAPGVLRSYLVYRAAAAWTASTITWNNQPGVASSATDTADIGTISGVWVNWDVTADVQAFVNGSPNYGWRINDSVEGSSTNYQASFYSAEYTDPTYYPQLVVSYQ